MAHLWRTYCALIARGIPIREERIRGEKAIYEQKMRGRAWERLCDVFGLYMRKTAFFVRKMQF